MNGRWPKNSLLKPGGRSALHSSQARAPQRFSSELNSHFPALLFSAANEINIDTAQSKQSPLWGSSRDYRLLKQKKIGWELNSYNLKSCPPCLEPFLTLLKLRLRASWAFASARRLSQSLAALKPETSSRFQPWLIGDSSDPFAFVSTISPA